MDRTNICIVGAGAVGLTLAVKLARSHAVWLLARPYQLESLGGSPYRLEGAEELVLPSDRIRVVTVRELEGLPRDLSYWICVKAYDLDEALADIAPRLNRATPVVLLSNGLGIFFQASLLVGRKAPLMRLCPSFGARKLAPTEVALAGRLSGTFAALEQDLACADPVLQIARGIFDQITLERSIAAAEWNKALVNLVVNPICSIVNAENGALLRNPHLKRLASAALEEIRAVARADGFDLSQTTDEIFLAGLERHASNINSTLCDLRAGKKTELDYLLGRFLRLAADHGVEIPVCQSLYSLVKFLEDDTLAPTPAWPERKQPA
jgi:2-dehydropantoate 2-reductase